MATSSVCGCFGNLRTRYKRLVDNVFPSDPSQGLVKNNMEKLTFYALSAPEKLDRIGEYLFQKMNNHLYRKRIGLVNVCVEAMDHLLLACRSSSLNLFVESFLKMVHTLLESTEVDLHISAANSFVKFANIEEDTPSYHRRYEFFISRFSQLCYGTHPDPDTEKQVRLSGIRGLQGVVRKTVNDDLQANIWDDVHMSKITQALIFNIESDEQVLSRQSSMGMLTTPADDNTSPSSNDDPGQLADLCLRELVTRASFNNIASILYPILTFMDSRELWLKTAFPLHIFRLVMFSIQNQYSYRAIEILLSHLDKHKSSEPEMKASVVEMISASVAIATNGSIGPSILDVFNTLLKHLKISIDVMYDPAKKKNESSKGEKLVQGAIVSAAGAFSSTLLDYQRVDVMLFILLKVPSQQNLSIQELQTEDMPITEADAMLQVNLLKSLLKVAESHQIKHFSSTFSTKFMDAILAGLHFKKTDVRTYFQKLLVSLLDRRNNLESLEKLCDTPSCGFSTWNVEKCSKQDAAFIRKNGQQFTCHLYEGSEVECCTRENYKLLANIICLLALEFNEEENVVLLTGFVLGLQDLACTSSHLSNEQKCCLHACCLLYFLLLSDITSIPMLHQHTQSIVESRTNVAPRLLPTIFTQEDRVIEMTSLDKSIFFDRDTITIALRSNKYETKSIETPYVPKPAVRANSATSIPDHFPIVKTDSTLSVASSITGNETPAVQRITYEDLKDALREKVEKKEELLDLHTFQQRTATTGSVRQENEAKLIRTIDTKSSQHTEQIEIQKNLFEIDFPSLYIY